MAARKLHMQGARERLGAGAGAVAEGVVQNGNGVCVHPTGGSRYENRVASPIMQPLPLASRYGGANHDSLRPASAALQSTWIQRLRPASPDVFCGELGHEVAHVWRDPQPALWRSSTPLLLAGPSKEPLLHPVPKMEPQLQPPQADDGRNMRWTVGEASKAPARNSECSDKGKGRSQVHGHTAHETTLTSGQRKNDNSRTAPAQQVKPPVLSTCPKGIVASEGSSRRQDSPQLGNSEMLINSSQNPQPNGVSGGLVTGFGPLRVVLNSPVGNTVNKSLGTSSKLKGPVMEGIQAADVPPSDNHYMAGTDRNRVASSAGPKGMMTWVPAGNIQPKMKSSPDRNLDIDRGRHIVGRGELFGGGFYPFQRTGYGSDNCRPFILHQSQAPGKDRTFSYPSGPKENRAAGGFVVAEDHRMAHSMKEWYPGFSAIGNNGDMTGKGIAANQSLGPIMAEDGRSDCGPQQEGKYLNRTNPDACGKHVYVANGSESWKAKETLLMDNKCYADVGLSQQQASHLSPLFAPYQSPSHMSFGKQPFPFSFAGGTYCGVEEEVRRGDEGGDSSQERPEQASSLTPLLFGPQERRQNGVENTPGKPPWSSLFAAYKVPNQPGEPPNSNSSTGTLPLDGRLMVHDGQNPGNRLCGGLRASGKQDNESGCSVVPFPGASSGEARSMYDNHSSHFSSSPWPVDDGYNPTDDAGSTFHSQASHTPLSQVPSAVQTPNTLSKGQEHSRYKCGVGGSSGGGSKNISYKRARSREHSWSLSPGFSGGMEGSRGSRSSDDENHTRGAVKNSRQPHVSSFSGQKDDTSGSSPPSLPMGCNDSSALCSPAVPVAGAEERGKCRAMHSRTANLGRETDFMLLGKGPQRMTGLQGGLVARRRERLEPQEQIKLGLRGDHTESDARLCNDVETQEGQPMVGEAFREVPGYIFKRNETGEFGHKHNRLRSSTDVVGAAGTSGPSKRSRHHPNQDSLDFEGGASGVQAREEENGGGTDKPSTWLSRWVPAGSNNNGVGVGMNSPTSAKPKDGNWNGPPPRHPVNSRPSGAGVFFGDCRGQGNRTGGHMRRIDENGSDQWNSMKDRSSKRGVFGLPPYPVASAAAIALVGTAARKLGPLPSQRKGPIAMWPSVHLEMTQTPEAQKSVRSPELSTYVEQS